MVQLLIALILFAHTYNAPLSEHTLRPIKIIDFIGTGYRGQLQPGNSINGGGKIERWEFSTPQRPRPPIEMWKHHIL
jgi:hypothetical protein